MLVSGAPFILNLQFSLPAFKSCRLYKSLLGLRRGESFGYTTISIGRGLDFQRACERRILQRTRGSPRPHTGNKPDPIKFRIVQVEHRKGLRSGIAGSDPREFDIEDRI
jgi:hypothetical protein